MTTTSRKKHSLKLVMENFLKEDIFNSLPNWTSGESLTIKQRHRHNFTWAFDPAGPDPKGEYTSDWKELGYKIKKGFTDVKFPSNFKVTDIDDADGYVEAKATISVKRMGLSSKIGVLHVKGAPSTFLAYATGPAIAQDSVEAELPPLQSTPDEPTEGDRDGDGILDGADKCPNKPEDYDRIEDTDGCPEAEDPLAYTAYKWEEHIRPGGGWSEGDWEDFIDKAKSAGKLNGKEAMAAKSDWGKYASLLGYAGNPGGAKSFFNKVKSGTHSKKDDSELPNIPNYSSGRGKGIDEGKRYSLLKLMEGFLRD